MSNNKSQAITHFNDAGKLYNIKLYDEALELYKKAIEVDMTFADAHFCLAKTYIRNKEYQKGINHFQKFYHLIAESKQGAYVLALSNILIEENQSEQALKLTEDLNIELTQQQVFDYVPLLFSNNRENQAINTILQLNDANTVSKGYNKLIENESLGKQVIEKLTNESVIPRYFVSKNRLQKLSVAGIQHKEYASYIKEAQDRLRKIQTDKNSNYVEELSDVETIILSSQDILAKQSEIVLKSNNLEYSKKLIGILESTKYPKENLLPLQQSLKGKESAKNKKNRKIAVISFASVIILAVASYFGYNAYKKSDAYDRALQSNSISGYSAYLNNYGDDEKLHALREDKLYQKSITLNNADDLNKLSSLYPNSEKLRTITITTNGNTDNIEFFGIGDESKYIKTTSANTIKVPVGSKIGYRINEIDKIPVTKFFTVTNNLKIKETLYDTKSLLFSDNFSSNTNGWETFREYKNVYGKNKNKGVSVSNGELQIFHEYQENKFILSTTYLSKLTRNIDFEIEASINRNEIDNGTFLLFGATKRGFNYIGFNNRGNCLYGYNNWDNSNDNWIKLSNGWQYNQAIKRGKYDNNILKVVKKNNEITYYINGQYLGFMTVNRWYGNRIGFGINDRTKAKINYLKVSQLRNYICTEFEKNKTYFCWVDELNVRADGTRTGEILTTLKKGEPVKYLGETGKKKINATFKEIFSPDYYYKVELVDGTVGWVHGGALKYLPTQNQINFDEYKKK